jgi:hypothetical protein
LFLVSLRVEACGPGRGSTIVELFETLQGTLREWGQDQQLADLLERSYGFSSQTYSAQRWALTGPEVVILVDSRIPALTPASIAKIVGNENLSRLRDLQYTVDLEGFSSDTVLEDLCRLKLGGG